MTIYELIRNKFFFFFFLTNPKDNYLNIVSTSPHWEILKSCSKTKAQSLKKKRVIVLSAGWLLDRLHNVTAGRQKSDHEISVCS